MCRAYQVPFRSLPWLVYVQTIYHSPWLLLAERMPCKSRRCSEAVERAPTCINDGSCNPCQSHDIFSFTIEYNRPFPRYRTYHVPLHCRHAHHYINCLASSRTCFSTTQSTKMSSTTPLVAPAGNAVPMRPSSEWSRSSVRSKPPSYRVGMYEALSCRQC